MARKKPEIEILHRDDHVVAIDKPSGVSSTRERWDPERPTALDLTAALLERAEGAPVKLRLVHRIDKDTSGILLFAANADAGRALSKQFLDRKIAKVYLALIAGAPREPEGVIEARLDKNPRQLGTMQVVKHRGKVATTRYETDERFRGYALMRVMPETGRTHQIRVHLAHAGMPLAVDPVYGGARTGIPLSELKRNYRPSRRKEEPALISRLTLHAWRITFAHPETGEPTTIEAPLPKDLALVLKNLRRYQAI
jgi:RluA family pseudouridine synthase